MKKQLVTLLVSLVAGLSSFSATVQLMWDANAASEKVEGYVVYQTAPTSLVIGTTKNTFFPINPSSTPVSYAVAASNTVGTSALSAAITPPVAATAPSGLTFAPPTRNPQSLDVVLSWTASPTAEAVSGYNVYKLVTGAWVLVGSSTTPTFTATGLAMSSHTFSVRSVNLWGESPASTSVTTPPIPSTPSGLKISVN